MSQCQIIRSTTPISSAPQGKVYATLGKYDALHLGHQKVIRALGEEATSGQGSSVLIAFYPHPRSVLDPKYQGKLILSLRQRLTILSGLGIDYLYLIHFTKALSKLSAKQFLNDYLLRRFDLTKLLIGEDAKIGRRQSADAGEITRILAESSVNTRMIEFDLLGQRKISSRDVHLAVESADFRAYRELCGRNYQLAGTVVRGRKLARQLGYPTANIKLSNKITYPPYGVYQVQARLGETKFSAVCNLGVKPTFGTNSQLLEVHLIDYDGNAEFYGSRLEVSFERLIRREQRFTSGEELQRQIAKDIEALE